jgi:hypothetical protein
MRFVWCAAEDLIGGEVVIDHLRLVKDVIGSLDELLESVGSRDHDDAK